MARNRIIYDKQMIEITYAKHVKQKRRNRRCAGCSCVNLTHKAELSERKEL